MNILKEKIKFSLMIMGKASEVSPIKNFFVVLSVIISSAAITLCPAMLGYSVSLAYRYSNSAEWKTYFVLAVSMYILLWFIGQAFKYFFYPWYGLIEQKSQSKCMVDSYENSTNSDPRFRYSQNSSEISFAIDAKSGAMRETLYSLYLSIIPAIVGVFAGALSILFISGYVDLLIFVAFVILYILGSMPMISRHQMYQGKFFGLSVKSFGVLENFISLWKEGVVFSAVEFLKNKYSHDRLPVENEAIKSYFWTMVLYIWQASILTICLSIIVFKNIIYTDASSGVMIGNIISLVGVCVSAIGPLQGVGFGISNIAVSYTRYYEAEEKILHIAKIKNSQEFLISKNTFKGSLSLNISLEEAREAGLGYCNISPGRPVWIIGPSGSGKTVILERILGVLPLEKPGSITLYNSTGDPQYTYLPQEPGLFAGSAAENIDFGRNVSPERIDSLLRSLGLSDFSSNSRRGMQAIAGEEGSVSGGEGRRIALARALLCPEGSVIVLDEPTAGLDASTRDLVWSYIEEASRDSIVLVTTHDNDAPIQDGDLILPVSS